MVSYARTGPSGLPCIGRHMRYPPGSLLHRQGARSRRCSPHKELAAQEHLDIRFETCVTEDTKFPPRFFDIISCGQSWLYFDTQRMIPLVKTWLHGHDR
jgi:hypothetical protein